LLQPQNIRTGNKEFVGHVLAFVANNSGDAIDFGVMLQEDAPYLARCSRSIFELVNWAKASVVILACIGRPRRSAVKAKLSHIARLRVMALYRRKKRGHWTVYRRQFQSAMGLARYEIECAGISLVVWLNLLRRAAERIKENF
jgi:hypothetical protein